LIIITNIEKNVHRVFRNLMYLMKDKIPAGIVFSQTDELNKFWRQSPTASAARPPRR